MARSLKIFGFGIVFLCLLVLGGALTLRVGFPRQIPIEDITVDPDLERVERGAYLVNTVANCMNCHGERDWTKISGPVKPETLGRGAPLESLGSTIYSANLTPAALGNWSDGELARAITSGLDADGRVLHPEMPFSTYSRLAREDLYAIIAYLRHLPSIDYEPPTPEQPLLLSLIARALPKSYQPKLSAPPDESLALGKYLISIAGCRVCHGRKLGGGISMSVPSGGEVVSANLTRAPNARISQWSKQDFIAMFQSFRDEDTRAARIKEGETNTVMPWLQYAYLNEKDLGAIFDYLVSLEPVIGD